MNIYSDNVIIIEFDPTSEILCARWHSIRNKKMFELEHSIHALVGKIEELNVKKLLLYSIRNVSEVPFGNFESFMLLLISSLAESSIRKVARLVFDDSEIQEITDSSDAINKGMGVMYQYRTFKDRQDGIDWLEQ